MKVLRKLRKNEMGATAIEYALVASLISIAALMAMQGLGSNVNKTFTNVSATLAS